MTVRGAREKGGLRLEVVAACGDGDDDIDGEEGDVEEGWGEGTKDDDDDGAMGGGYKAMGFEVGENGDKVRFSPCRFGVFLDTGLNMTVYWSSWSDFRSKGLLKRGSDL